jgi:hypothetical protein
MAASHLNGRENRRHANPRGNKASLSTPSPRKTASAAVARCQTTRGTACADIGTARSNAPGQRWSISGEPYGAEGIACLSEGLQRDSGRGKYRILLKDLLQRRKADPCGHPLLRPVRRRSSRPGRRPSSAQLNAGAPRYHNASMRLPAFAAGPGSSPRRSRKVLQQHMHAERPVSEKARHANVNILIPAYAITAEIGCTQTQGAEEMLAPIRLRSNLRPRRCFELPTLAR